jgi:hypothetical protein
MGAEKLVRLRVLPARSLSLPDGSSYVAADELQLPAADAHPLIDKGFLCKAADYENAVAAARDQATQGSS